MVDRLSEQKSNFKYESERKHTQKNMLVGEKESAEKSRIQSYYTLKHMQVGVNKGVYIRGLHKGK